MRTKITIEIETDDYAGSLDVQEMRQTLATAVLNVWIEPAAFHGDPEDVQINAVRVDSLPLDFETGQLAALPDYITPEVVEFLMKGQKIQAIKEIRSNSTLSLGEAKAVVDNYRVVR